MMADLRPDDRDDSVRGFRTLILDAGLNPEQRGRILRACVDIETYRILALRGYSYFETMDVALGELSRQTNLVYSGVYKTHWSRGALIRFSGKLEKAYSRIRLLSSALALLNFVVTFGITGRQLAASTFQLLVSDRLTSLREIRVEGYSTLSSFLRKFEGSIANIRRAATRYDILRRRIGEAAELIRAESQLNNTQNTLVIGVLITIGVAFVPDASTLFNAFATLAGDAGSLIGRLAADIARLIATR
jgi:uncharacterized membrane-anchored protein